MNFTTKQFSFFSALPVISIVVRNLIKLCTMKPTDELYNSLLAAYSHFNKALFNNKLPEVIFTVQRQRGVLGYFAPDRWSSVTGNHCHEIAINPTHMGDSRVIEVLQTLVHEMVHCWQHCFGKPARSCYHNKEWAYKMIEVGLQPTSTGMPGGAITGQQMSDFPIADGMFLKSCYTLVNKGSFALPWIDRRLTPKSALLETAATQIPDHIEAADDVGYDEDTVTELLTANYSDLMPEDTFIPVQRQATKAKQKYQCPSCRTNVWGKPELYIICGECDKKFEET